jgi:deoxyuridine 5'-triphosphate nucleotidohydrolase
MNISIKRFDKTLLLPEYKTRGAAAFDLSARITLEIKAQTIGYVPLNIAIQLPDDHFALMSARSSLHKRGLMMVNGIGIGDADYRGDDDEYHAALFNFSDTHGKIETGERIVQLLILPREKIELKELAKFDAPNRGGFGSTGRK